MKKSVFLMILITVLAWGATLWLDPPAPNMRSLMHEVYYLDGLLAWEAFAGAILLMTQPRLVAGLTGASFPEIGFWHKALGVSAILLSLIHWGTRMIFSPLVEPFATEPVPHIARHERKAASPRSGVRCGRSLRRAVSCSRSRPVFL